MLGWGSAARWQNFDAGGQPFRAEKVIAGTMMQPPDRSCRRAALLVSAVGATIGQLVMAQPALAQSLLAQLVLAQQSPAQISQAVVQAVPVKSAGMRLNDALNRLARSPTDVEALIAAGRASLDLGDVQAAIGFYQRAETLWPGSARIKAGLAGAYTLGDDPVTAIGMFSDAEKLGPIDADRTADRALAYDLVGDGQTAQRFYRQSMTLAATDEAQRRMAVSLAIAGDRRGMESLLSPLLQRQDKAAWRSRAFALAILGQVDEAESIVRQTMPADKASAMANYLRYMTKLTSAQQAGAANLGRFPRAADIGRDDPRITPYARARVKLAAILPAAPPAKAESKKDNSRKARELAKAVTLAAAARPVRVQPAAIPVPPVSRGLVASSAELAPVAIADAARPLPAPVAAPILAASTALVAAPAALPPMPAPVLAPVPAPVPEPMPAPVLATVPAPIPAPARVAAAAIAGIAAKPAALPAPGFAMIGPSPAPPAALPQVTFDLRSQTPAPAATAPAATVIAAAVPNPKPDSLDDAFADFTPPSREVEPQSGAVDVRQVRQQALAAAAKDAANALAAKSKDKAARDKLAKEKAAKDAKDAKDAKTAEVTQPSRVWVQVATGRDKSALGSDWRKLVRNDPEVFKTRKPSVTAWGQANRLLAGPFGSQKEALAFVAAVKKAGVGGAFVWSSPAGQPVDPLGSGK